MKRLSVAVIDAIHPHNRVCLCHGVAVVYRAWGTHAHPFVPMCENEFEKALWLFANPHL